MAARTPLILLIFTIAIEVALACNGYKARIIKVENCAGPDAIITIDDQFSVKLNKKCEIVPTGCVLNKAFKTAIAKYKLQKDGIVLNEGKFDMCTAIDHVPDEAKDMLKIIGVPTSCPLPEEKICANENRANLSKYKAMLGMAKGNFILDSEITHDTGKSCFHVEFEIAKK